MAAPLVSRLAPGIEKLSRAAENLGFPQAALYALQRLRGRGVRPRRLYSRHLRHPVLFRPGSSDLEVFRQILVNREYRCVDDIARVGLVLDCGANVGYSSAYFLSRFPEAQVVAVEPDPSNFALLERNVAPYGGRCRTVNSAVWARPAGLVFSDFGDRREWAVAVREASAGEKPALFATGIGTLLDESGFERVSILKVDIEGSEASVFSSGFEGWIGRVDNLVIEIHNPECEAIFLRAIAGEGFQLSRCDELYVCRRAAPAS